MGKKRVQNNTLDKWMVKIKPSSPKVDEINLEGNVEEPERVEAVIDNEVPLDLSLDKNDDDDMEKMVIEESDDDDEPGLPGAGPSSGLPVYKYGKSGIHYTSQGYGSGISKCNKCNEEIVDVVGQNTNIQTHCKKCFPELGEQARLRKQKSRGKNRDVYRQSRLRARQKATQQEHEGRKSGEEPTYKCTYLNCTVSFHTPFLLSDHEAVHKYRGEKDTYGFFSSFKEKISHKEPSDSQGSHGSEQSTTSSELKRTQVLQQTLQEQSNYTRYYMTYFVIVLDKEAENFANPVDYLRSIKNRPKKEIGIYVGKKTMQYSSDHDIATDHETRPSSSLFDACKNGSKIAYEIARNRHDNVAEMEAEEAFWLLVARYRNLCEDSPNLAQWKFVNKHYEYIPAQSFSTDVLNLAQQLARENHPLICAGDNCQLVHGRTRPYYGKFHIDMKKVKKLVFSFDL